MRDSTLLPSTLLPYLLHLSSIVPVTTDTCLVVSLSLNLCPSPSTGLLLSILLPYALLSSPLLSPSLPLSRVMTNQRQRMRSIYETEGSPSILYLESLTSVQLAQLADECWVKTDMRRARVLIEGLEPVSESLLSRYYSIINDQGNGHAKPTPCVVCIGPITPDDAMFRTVVAFPCLHLFHSECLLPWLALRTTCPVCRHDVDPRSLTLRGVKRHIWQRWVPPARKGAFKAWVQAEERRRSRAELKK